ncbi:High affinity nitrate transporter 2.5 [Bienertia sinuspersici]
MCLYAIIFDIGISLNDWAFSTINRELVLPYYNVSVCFIGVYLDLYPVSSTHFSTAPAVYLSAVAHSAIGYFLMRFFTGFALVTFVSTQYWMSSMFSPRMSSAFAVMFFGQDLPDGNFHQLQKSGNMHKDNASKVL